MTRADPPQYGNFHFFFEPFPNLYQKTMQSRLFNRISKTFDD